MVKIILSMLVLLIAGCAHRPSGNELIEKCVEKQVRLYGDLCAESSSGYEGVSGSEAHFLGVECATESITSCMEDE